MFVSSVDNSNDKFKFSCLSQNNNNSNNNNIYVINIYEGYSNFSSLYFSAKTRIIFNNNNYLNGN